MNRLAIGVVAVVAGLSGCQTPAQVRQKGPDSVVIAIPENTNNWPTHYRDAAEALAKAQIGLNYMIVDEREVVTGGNNTAGPMANVTPASKEYRITYQKKPIPPGNPIGGSVPSSLGARQPLPGAGLGAGPQAAGGFPAGTYPPPPGGYVPGGMTSPSSSSAGMLGNTTVPSVAPAAGGYPVGTPNTPPRQY